MASAFHHGATILARRQDILACLQEKEARREQAEREENRRLVLFERALRQKRYEQARTWKRRARAHQRWLESLPEELRFTLHIQRLGWWDGPNPQPRSSWRRIERFGRLETY